MKKHVEPEERKDEKYGRGPGMTALPRARAENDARRLRTLEERAKDLSRRLAEETKRADAAENLRDAVFHLTGSSADRRPVHWPERKVGRGKKIILLPMLFGSDFQCGEVIKPSEMDGINAYNMDIFAERFQCMIAKTIEWADEHVGAAAEFPGVFYLRGGDAISGSIHAELAETNDLSAVPALRWLYRHEIEGIRRLRDRFGRVRVISIPGNHGRTTLKPRSKSYVDLNFETLLAYWLESRFDDDPAVEFCTPPSGDAFFVAEGWNVLLSHGDRMGSRGGQGFIGPVATIARGHKKLFDNYARTGNAPDIILTGHLHTSLKLETGYANGCLPGYNEYARDLRAFPDAAKQWLFFLHKTYGVSHAVELILGPMPRRS